MKGPSAYFIFAQEHRDAVKAELEARDGSKAGVAAVGKEIGARWQQLSEEEKQVYKEKAAALKEQQAASQAAVDEAAASGGGSPGGAGVEDAAAAHEAPAGGGAAPPPFGLPTSLVKKIMSMDAEVQRVSADGVRCVAKAAELFLQLLAEKALRNAAQVQRKNLRFQDIEAVAGRDRRMVDMGLNALLADDAVFAEVHERQGEENQSRRGNKGKEEEALGKGVQHITAFFTAGAAPAAAVGEQEEGGAA